ncbi:MAG: hypothetical protein HS113_18155 [Verrucomicrobiales bacterium]|nr:hypothetical protein [Verrucomicrobiales bacterium]
MAIQIAARFRFAEDWYRAAPLVGLVLAYYAVLRSVLRAQPELRRCRVRCRHCGIFFLTHPRNAGRQDLRCPFGCRQAHRRQQGNQRTAAYYREEAGRDKKRNLNAKRRKTPASRPAAPLPAPGPSAASAPPADGLPAAWPRTMLPYLQMVSGLIEGRPVSREEVVAMLRRALRQHRMVRTRRRDHTVAWLHAEPP